MFSYIFYTFFYEPILNLLVWLVGVLPWHDVGLAVVIVTVVVRFIIFPFTHKATMSQKKMQELSPQLKEIKEKFKKDSQAQAKQTMELYKKHGINPFSSIITLVVQIPIFIALYKIFTAGFTFGPPHLYSFISIPENINTSFLGMFDMSQKSYFLAALASITQFFQTKLAMPPIKKENILSGSFKDSFAQSMNLQMRYIMPVIIFIIASRFFSAFALYWTTMNIFAIVHEVIIRNKAKKIGTADRNN